MHIDIRLDIFIANIYFYQSDTSMLITIFY